MPLMTSQGVLLKNRLKTQIIVGHTGEGEGTAQDLYFDIKCFIIQ